jgi:hypothetical protein
VITGLSILNAGSYDEAVELCRDCPAGEITARPATVTVESDQRTTGSLVRLDPGPSVF